MKSLCLGFPDLKQADLVSVEADYQLLCLIPIQYNTIIFDIVSMNTNLVYGGSGIF